METNLLKFVFLWFFCNLLNRINWLFFCKILVANFIVLPVLCYWGVYLLTLFRFTIIDALVICVIVQTAFFGCHISSLLIRFCLLSF